MSGSPAPPEPTDPTMAHLLAFVAAEFTGCPAGSGTVADFLRDMATAVAVYGQVRAGRPPPREALRDKSVALTRLEVALYAAQRFSRASAASSPTSPTSPSVLPAGLEIPPGVIGGSSRPWASSAQDEITLLEAADLLEMSPEGVRLAIQRGEIAGHQEGAGHRRWRVQRASVLAYEQRRSA